MSLHNQSAMLYFILDLFKFNFTTTKILLSLYKNGLIYLYVYSHIFKMTYYIQYYFIVDQLAIQIIAT